jgi:hypothetical protein
MSRLPRAIGEKILLREGALTAVEAATVVGAKTLAEFDRWRRLGVICEPILGTKLWDPTELYRSIDRLPAPNLKPRNPV